MRRWMCALALVSLFAFGATTVAVAKPDGKQGARKIALYERESMPSDPNEPGDGEQVGWAVANTTADGYLNVQVHVVGPPTEELAVWVKINRPIVGTVVHPVAWFETNRQGIGGVHIVLDLLHLADPPYAVDLTREAIGVQVVVKRPDDAPWWVGYASATESVPLK
jgi:hypothetical protein